MGLCGWDPVSKDAAGDRSFGGKVDRDVELDMASELQVETFLSRLIEFTLGALRSTWEQSTTPLSPKLAVVRPYWSTG